MATVTPAYRDTLTWGGDHPWTILGWSQLLSAKYKGTVSSMDGSGLSTAPLDISGIWSPYAGTVDSHGQSHPSHGTVG